jgi:hypothetical protein
MTTHLETLPALAPAAAALGKPLHVRAFDATAMGLYPLVARAFGYSFRVGNDAALVADAKSVHRGVWSRLGVAPAADAVHFGERYDRAVSTWIVAYHRGRPVGVMALLDMAVASIALDYEGCVAPTGLDLATTREISRLAVVEEHRGNGQLVMVGLLREMLAWSMRQGIARLFGGARTRLFLVYRRFNPTARLVTAPPATSKDPLQARYFEALRRYGGTGCMFTFEVAGASPWAVFSSFLRRRAGRRRAA